jgi:hypothetical protein
LPRCWYTLWSWYRNPSWVLFRRHSQRLNVV